MSPSPPPEPPAHRTFESPWTRSIAVGDWVISATTKTISGIVESDRLAADLDIPLPEMTFGGNALTLKHAPSGAKLAFTTPAALRCVAKGELGPGDGAVKVGYADKWLRSRSDPFLQMNMPVTVAAKPYDWTYTTTYSGHDDFVEMGEDGHPLPVSDTAPPQPRLPWRAADPDDPGEVIPMDELARPDPILFYAEIPLYEDELHDNGASTLIARVRVMPTCWFILLRFTLRVDHVLFRTFDTRIYHSFASSPPILIREVSGWEAPYGRIQRLLPRYDDLTPLTDPTYIAKVLSELPKEVSQKEGANTGWRGMGSKSHIAILRPKVPLTA